MITPSFSLTATERVLPKLALDFTTGLLDNRVTFTRTTDATHPATYVNSSGYVTSATNNQARFDYDPVTRICKGLLIEESRSNTAQYSQDGSNIYWQKTGLNAFGSGSIVNATASPDNTVTANYVQEDANLSSHVIYLNGTFVSGTAYTFSIYAAPKERTQITLRFLASTAWTTNRIVTFNLANGTVLASSGVVTSTISPAANGFYRCTITATADANGSGSAGYYLTNNSATTYQGNGTSGLYWWGAQLEAGAFATSYIPTTSAALTRNADVATMTGTNFSSWWTATTGASDIWLIPKSTSTFTYMCFDDNTANNKIIVANSTTSGQSIITSGGVLQATLTAGTITANATNKVGCSWNTNNCAATANATTPATSANATIPTVTQLRIGGNGTTYANSWIQKLFYWPQRITNNEIQSFTK